MKIIFNHNFVAHTFLSRLKWLKIVKKSGNSNIFQHDAGRRIFDFKLIKLDQGAIHGKQCWYGGLNNTHGGKRQFIEINAFGCNTDNSDCDYANQYCVAHSKFTRKTRTHGNTTSAEDELDKEGF